MLNVGDAVEAMVLGLDPQARRISLGLKQLGSNPWQELAERYPVGSRIVGKVRNLTEFGAFVAASPILRLVGRGDRHPVLVLPGFMADDRSTIPLRWTLRNQGYWVHGWRLGTNLPTETLLDSLRDRLAEISQPHGNPVSIVGWRLG